MSSTTIQSIGYDPMTALLEIEFTHGDVYQYFMVPASTHLGMVRAASKGRFFGEFIRGRYQFRKVE